jgi:hypothetical protein
MELDRSRATIEVDRRSYRQHMVERRGIQVGSKDNRRFNGLAGNYFPLVDVNID